MNPLISSRQAELEALCARYGVRRLDLFGSATRDDFDSERSDLDFLVIFDRAPVGKRVEQYFGFRAALAALFQKDVDLVEDGVVTNRFVLESINESRTPVYVAA